MIKFKKKKKERTVIEQRLINDIIQLRSFSKKNSVFFFKTNVRKMAQKEHQPPSYDK